MHYTKKWSRWSFVSRVFTFFFLFYVLVQFSPSYEVFATEVETTEEITKEKQSKEEVTDAKQTTDVEEEAENRTEKKEKSLEEKKSKDKKKAKDKEKEKTLEKKQKEEKRKVDVKKKEASKKKSEDKKSEKKKNKGKKAKKIKLNGKKVYLTFDDGPSENTDEVLKILDKYEVKGTFFVIGKTDKESLRRYKEIVKKGHTIALHSYTHRYKEIYANLDAFKKDFKRISDLIYKVTGIRSNYYRFPGGTSNTISPTDMNVFVNYFNKKGIKYFDWNVQCGDAVTVPPAPSVLYHNVIHSIKSSRGNSFIVLIHDSKPMKNSVKALPRMIERLKKDGYQLLPIDEDTVPVHHKAAKR